MKLGWSEWQLMNHPFRVLMRRLLEVPRLLRMGGPCPHARALEIGSGNGSGTDLLFERFGIQSLDTFDLDERMVRLCAHRHRHRSRSMQPWVGNVRHIPASDARYDAVFDFGVLHHVHDWPSALKEIHRVLRPGGRFYIEEITRQFITHPIWRRLLDHPQENRFDQKELVAVLVSTGFEIRQVDQLAGLFIWCVADRT